MWSFITIQRGKYGKYQKHGFFTAPKPNNDRAQYISAGSAKADRRSPAMCLWIYARQQRANSVLTCKTGTRSKGEYWLALRNEIAAPTPRVKYLWTAEKDRRSKLKKSPLTCARVKGGNAVNYKSLPLFTVKYQNKEQVSHLSIPNAANSNRCKRKKETAAIMPLSNPLFFG